MVPKNTKEEATSFLDILSLRRNYTDAPIEEERPQNSETTEICFFSQPESLRKGSLTDFASFKFTKLKSDHSDRSSGNMEVFCSQGLPTFEDSKPFQISFANSQPNPGSEDENLGNQLAIKFSVFRK